MTSTPPSLLVVGGGIAGLAGAWEAVRQGVTDVTVVEADSRMGGRIRTSDIDGITVDEAADAFLARVPWGLELCRELGLEDQLVSPAARNAFVYSRGDLRPLPSAQVLGVPLDLAELAATGILDDDGVEEARQAIAAAGPETGDDTIGAVLRRQVGAEVATRLVDPLVGGINAGDTDRLSLRAVVPQLAAVADHPDGLVAGLRAARAANPPDPDAPVFFGLPGGTDRLVDRLVEALEQAGATLRTATPARRVRRSESGGFEVATGGGAGTLQADRVLLATAAPVTARLVRAAAPEAAEALDTVEHASVAMVTLVHDVANIERDLNGSGFLVPRTEGFEVTACSWASSKWAHLHLDDRVVLRASVGRFGADDILQGSDQDILAAVGLDLAVMMGIRDHPRAVRVSRWHSSLPQYAPGHLDLVDRIEADLAARMPGLAVAGSAYRGIGLPACIHSGRRAVASLVA